MSHEPLFTVSVADLDEGVKDYSFRIEAGWLMSALDDNDAKGEIPSLATGAEGKLDVRLSKSGPDVVVQGHIKADVKIPCARCLEPSSVPVETDLTALLVPASALKIQDGEHELSAEEADVVPYDGETVVLDDLVRDEILLAIPMIPLCSEDCPGMSPGPRNTGREQAGSFEPPVDPRLEPLRRLQSKLSKE
jgi:uncharacterized protein